MKRLFNRAFLIHYVAIGYTINNVVLYSNGLWALSEWVLHKIGTNWQLSSEIPYIVCIAILGIGFMFSNWKSYYKVIGDYLETARPTKKSKEAIFESIGVHIPKAAHHTVIVKEVEELPEQLLEEQRMRMLQLKREQQKLRNPATDQKQKKRVFFLNMDFWDRFCAASGSILKATASSAAWFTWMDMVGGTWAAIGTTLFFAPACTISQIAFLSLGSAKQEKEEEFPDDILSDSDENGEIDPENPPSEKAPLITPRKPATVISINHWDKPFA